ncbi:hypothetical protein [Nostoc linckia]|uniref:hypothetical protein n=1 Tax=Nostoc linckia TaxID=92942 RepID=UPI001FD24A2B|nr:hypothetical protein [Nostoc linckia]
MGRWGDGGDKGDKGDKENKSCFSSQQSTVNSHRSTLPIPNASQNYCVSKNYSFY